MADPRLNIRITAELGQIRQALNGLNTNLQQFKVQAERSTGGLNRGLQTAARAAASLAASLGAGLSVAALAAISDEAQAVNARLKLATKSTEEFNTAQRETFRIAQETRTSLKATSELYARIERSTRELGVNQATVLQLTETINKAAQLSGGGAGAEAALFQLSQGLASGQLRGEELNSVLEQTPRLAQAVADGMDLPIGKLREYAKEGKLSAAEVLRALLNQRDQVAKEFAVLPPSISGGFTQIRNAMVQYLATSQEAGSAAASLAGALKVVADNLPALIDGFIRLAQVVGAYLVTFRLLPALYTSLITLSGGLARANVTLGASFTAAGGVAGKALLGIRVALSGLIAAFAGWQLGSYLREQFVEVELFGIAMAAGLHKVAIRIQQNFGTAGTRLRLIFSEAFNWVLDQAAGMVNGLTGLLGRLPGPIGAAYRKMGASAQDALQGVKTDTTELAAEVAAADKKLADALASVEQGYTDLADAAVAARQAAAGGTGAGDIAIADTPTDTGGKASAFRADLELLRDSIERTLAELDRLYEEGEIGLREYFRRKAELQTAAVDAAIEQAQAELKVATTQEAQQQALVAIEKLQRDRAEIGPRVAREQAKAEEELARKLEDVKARTAELLGDTAAGARLAIARERAQLLKDFADDPEAQAVIGRLFDMETVRANLDAIRSDIQDTIGDLRSVEGLVAAQEEAGQLDPATAEETLQAIREASIEQLTRYRASLAALPGAFDNEDIIRQLREVDTELARIHATQNKLANDIKGQAVQSLAGFFTDLATGAKSFKDAFLDMVRSFVQGVAQLIAQELALKAVRGILSLGSTSVPVQHSGGMAGSGPRRKLGPMAAALFVGAPRFHSGGMPGLRADEVPAILQRGEEVLAKDDPRNAMNGGGRSSSGGGTRVINVIDPALVQDYLESSAGEETVLNIIGRNPGRVAQMTRG